MIDKQFRALINKYAILIFIGYSLTFLISLIARHVPPSSHTSYTEFIELLDGFNWIIGMVINIITAILILKDLKKLGLKQNLIVVMTLFFSLIGVTMFFITITREMKKNVSS